MGNRATRLAHHLTTALFVLGFTMFGVACGSDAAEPVVEAEPQEVIELDEPAPFDLPDNCEDLQDFAADARDAYDAAEVNTQDLVDAKARFDGAVNEQMLLGCG